MFNLQTIDSILTLNRPGVLQTGMAGGGQILSTPFCNFCLGGPIDLKLGMLMVFGEILYTEKKLEKFCKEVAQNADISIFRTLDVNSYPRDQRHINLLIKIQLDPSSSCKATAVWSENI